jgi:uncharacterized protein (DUF1778 family)
LALVVQVKQEKAKALTATILLLLAAPLLRFNPRVLFRPPEVAALVEVLPQQRGVLAAAAQIIQTQLAQPVIRQTLAHPKEILEETEILVLAHLLLAVVVALEALAATILMLDKTAV